MTWVMYAYLPLPNANWELWLDDCWGDRHAYVSDNASAGGWRRIF